jgi:hypothetical protein
VGVAEIRYLLTKLESAGVPTHHPRASGPERGAVPYGRSTLPPFVRQRVARLAYSLRRDALPVLRPLLRADDQITREAAKGAVDAIKHQNYNLYWDVARRSGSSTVVTTRSFQP